MGNNKHYNRETGKWAPTIEKQRQFNSEMVGAYTDYQMRQKNKKKPEQGVRGKFLEVYKTKGYVAAKQLINAKFGREVFTDEILIEWLELKKKVLEVYKEGTIEDAYKKADEINEEVGYPLVKKEYIDKWIEEERKKASKEENQKSMGENDDAR